MGAWGAVAVADPAKMVVVPTFAWAGRPVVVVVVDGELECVPKEQSHLQKAVEGLVHPWYHWPEHWAV